MIKITKSTLEKTVRLFLRSIPFLPLPELYDVFEDLNKSKKSINHKIDEAYEALKNSSLLIEELHGELKNRTEKLNELKSKYEEYSKLAEIEEEKVRPLLKEIEKTLGRDRKKERLVAFIINIIAGLIIFVLGVWLSPKITSLFDSKDTIIKTNNSGTIDVVVDSSKYIVKDSMSANKNRTNSKK
ncbi:MAG: hypothetical protein Q8N03_14675 [Ignavibacteria bacterium]|nr:hypothetical protein [Ignavibacteria bacterium]